jgi:hypothetical protein
VIKDKTFFVSESSGPKWGTGKKRAEKVPEVRLIYIYLITNFVNIHHYTISYTAVIKSLRVGAVSLFFSKKAADVFSHVSPSFLILERNLTLLFGFDLCMFC